MPYVTQNKRREIVSGFRPSVSSGELSYELTVPINDYLQRKPNGGWVTIAEVIGALFGVFLAFIIEIVLPYEQKKKDENGLVFSPWGKK